MKKILNIIKIVLFFSIVSICISAAAKVTEGKVSKEKYYDFMELSDQVDVLFFGSSHMLNSINPVQMYRDYGITGYNMAKPGGLINESYWEMMNALDYSNPKVVVIDLWAMDRDYQYIDIMEDFRTDEERRNSISLLHWNMDYWPLSKTKVNTVVDLISDNKLRAEILFDFIVYHDRWSSLDAKDFDEAYKVENSQYLLGGEQRRSLYTDRTIFQPVDMNQTLDNDSVCVKYLYKFITECKNRGIGVALTFMPMGSAYDQDVMATNRALQIADEFSIPFYNFINHDELTVINFDTDLSDDTHLNELGMYKMTSYIGSMLKTDFGLQDHRFEEGYDAWMQKVYNWDNFEKSAIINQTDIREFTRELIYNNMNAVVFMGGDSKAIDDFFVREFIKQITGTDQIDEAKNLNQPYALFIDGKNGVVVEKAGNTSVEENLPLVGNVTYIGAAHFGAIYPDSNFDEPSLLNMTEHYMDDAQVLIFDNDGNITHTKYFRLLE